ncbi:MAG: sulfite exporter TauE/SafE family protein [Pirellulaceae bacterium]|nr:sulfite exporter TauE/SafE family protein [Pirellulaceae bacterium]
MGLLGHNTFFDWSIFGADSAALGALSPTWVLAFSFLLGLLHALEPGHGKTAMWLYMASGVKRPWHPVVMGFSTAVSHSVSLFLIAMTVHAAHHVITCDHHHEHAISTGLQWFSTGLIFVIGLWMLVGALRGKSTTCSCCHKPEQSCASSDHVDTARDTRQQPVVQLGKLPIQHSPALVQLSVLHTSSPDPRTSAERQTPAEPPSPPVADRYRTTALLGVAIGLLPCPSALAAYLTSLSAGQPGTAYWTILLFSLGIGVSLTLVGWFLQWFGAGLSNRMSRFKDLPWPILRAALILCVAVVYAFRLV